MVELINEIIIELLSGDLFVWPLDCPTFAQRKSCKLWMDGWNWKGCWVTLALENGSVVLLRAVEIDDEIFL